MTDSTPPDEADVKIVRRALGLCGVDSSDADWIYAEGVAAFERILSRTQEGK